MTFHDGGGDDVDVLALTDTELRAFRWEKLSMVFQGAMNALNPVTTVRAQLRDTLLAHRPGLSRAKVRERSEEVLRRVGVEPRRLGSYPHELSGECANES